MTSEELDKWEAEAKISTEKLAKDFPSVEDFSVHRILTLIAEIRRLKEVIQKKDADLSILSQYEPGNLQNLESILFSIKGIAREALAIGKDENHD